MTFLARKNAAFWIVAMSLFMAACSSDVLTEDMTGQLGLSPSIAFVLSDDISATRGVPVNNLNDLKDFRADAYLHRGGISIPYFQNQKQYDKAAGGVFRSDSARLWPSEQGDKMAFVAISPWAVAKNLTVSEQGDFTYTVPDNVVDQCDLMFATASDVECPANTVSGTVSDRDPVPMTFRHLLTQVRFVFGDNVANYWRHLTVHSVRVENVAATGTWSQTDLAWSVTDPPTHSFEVAADTTGPGSGVRPYGEREMEIWNSGYTMFLIPQTLPTDARVAVDMSHSVNLGTAEEYIRRKTYYIYLDGKKLLPGHTVTVEINSNDNGSFDVLDHDGNDVELRPLPAKGQATTFRLTRSGGADAVQIILAPECRSFATISSDMSSSPDATCLANVEFTIHTTDNTSFSDRFIRFVIFQSHDGQPGIFDHMVVLKQRGMVSYGSFSDVFDYTDTQQPWGFNWPSLNVSFYYKDAWQVILYYPEIADVIGDWSSMGTYNITLDYYILRSLVRTPNSTSDGLTNTRAINAHSFFYKPSTVMKLIVVETECDTVKVNGENINYDQFITRYPSIDSSAVMKAVGLNSPEPYNGLTGVDYVRDAKISCYLPAIMELETMARNSNTPLETGRTYWSSTVDIDGEPLALMINADGTFTRTKPGADALAYVHPVRKTE